MEVEGDRRALWLLVRGGWNVMLLFDGGASHLGGGAASGCKRDY